MTDAAAAAGVPLVYVNRQPINVDTLPDNQAFVASQRIRIRPARTSSRCAGSVARPRARTAVNVYVLQGELSNQAAVQRTQDIYDVIDAGECAVTINVIDQQTANWSRDEAQNLMTNWLSTGAPFDGVIANNDEMAIGAIQAMKAAGIDMDDGHRRRRRRDAGRAGLDAGGRARRDGVPERGRAGRAARSTRR